MEQVVDARELACPQPVILVRRAMRSPGGGTIVAVVDNDSARQNVTRMAEREGYAVAVEVRVDGIWLTLTPVIGARVPSGGEGAADVAPAARPGGAAPAEPGPLVLLVASDQVGRGDAAELGQILMRGFIHALGEAQPLPEVALFLNSGVRLVVDGSAALADLQALECRGMRIAACGTCLDYYGIKDRLAVGEITNMYTIAETLLGAGRIVNL